MVAQSGYRNAVADDLSSDPLMRRDPGLTRDLAPGPRRDSQVRRAPSSAGLYDVLDLILDKGIVVDAFVRVSLVGIEILTVDLRVVIASVDTYLRYAEGAERLKLYERGNQKQLPEIVGGGMKKAALAKGAHSVSRAVSKVTGSDDDDDDNDDDSGREREGRGSGGIAGTLTRGVRNVVGSLVGNGGDDDDAGNAQGDDRERDRTRGRDSERRRPDAREEARRGGGGGSRKAAAGARR